MHTFAVKALNVVLVISLVSAYHAVVSDRKADEAAAKKQLAEQQAAMQESETETESPYADGVYTGEAKGFGGPVKMEVTIADGQITRTVQWFPPKRKMRHTLRLHRVSLMRSWKCSLPM